MGRLNNRVALISGSGRGIGRAIAEKLAAEGASIVVNDIDEAPAADVVAAIGAVGGRAAACVGDVTAADFGERFVGTALQQFGGVDIIVNNAGYTWDNVIQKMSDEQFQAMLDVHTIAPFRILRAASEHIRAASREEAAAGKEVFRKVVNISSIAGTGGNAGQINYSSAKSSMIGLTKSMAKEWGRYKVNVNCVAFGFIGTRLTAAVEGEKPMIQVGARSIAVGVPSRNVEALKAFVPLGRAGTPEEAAGAVYLFCSPESDYVSGQVMVCGGGLE